MSNRDTFVIYDGLRDGYIGKYKLNYTRPWSRYKPECVYNETGDIEKCNMRRKAEILKYNSNSNKYTKKQLHSMFARGVNPSSKKSWALQKTNSLFSKDSTSNANTNNLIETYSNKDPPSIIRLTCNNQTQFKTFSSSSSNVPRSSTINQLYLDDSIKLVNYKVIRTYKGSSEKWPIYSWSPGDNGFPVGKKGGASNNFNEDKISFTISDELLCSEFDTIEYPPWIGPPLVDQNINPPWILLS